MGTLRAGAVLVLVLAVHSLLRLALEPPPSPAPLGEPSGGRPRPGQPRAAVLLYGGRLDLNSATLDDLAALPGLGRERARRIIRRRELGGRFRSVEELREVRGVGEKTFEQLRAHVSAD